jgi:putative transposase
MRYRAKRGDDGPLRERLKALAFERRRFGYRRLHVLLKREDWAVNKKRVQRIYREERLPVRKRGGRKRALGLRAPMKAPDRPNACWSLDFLHDQMTDGRRFRILTVVDECTRESLARVPDTSISGARAARIISEALDLREVERQVMGRDPAPADHSNAGLCRFASCAGSPARPSDRSYPSHCGWPGACARAPWTR